MYYKAESLFDFHTTPRTIYSSTKVVKALFMST